MSEEPNFVRGFLLTVLAGFATVLGCAFIPLTQSDKCSIDRATAAALGFAAGVMIWLSFVDVIGGEAGEFFEQHYAPAEAKVQEEEEGNLLVRVWVALFVFVGVAFTMLLDVAVAKCFGEEHGHGHGEQHGDAAPVAEGAASLNIENGEQSKTEEKAPHLYRVALTTMVALSLHNFPEGLATFVDGSNGGFTIAIAIALHNIPEGAAIAVPMFSSSNSWTKALGATAVAGLAQPLGALVGWLILFALQVTAGVPAFVFGCLYSVTAGIMIAISLMELIPEAFRLASTGVVMTAVLFGFAVMETSIIVLEATGA